MDRDRESESRPVARRVLLKRAAGLMSLTLLAACAPAATPAAPPTAAPPRPAANPTATTAPAQAAAKPANTAAPKPAAAGEQSSAALVEGARKEGQVVVWVHSMHQQEKVLASFKAKYPFLEVTVFDSRPPEILARLTQEAKAGKYPADVLYMGSEIPHFRDAGLLAEYEFPNTKEWPLQPKHNFYRAYHGNARVVAYNKNKVKAEDVPKNHEDLLDPKYQKYKFVLSTSGEDATMFYAAMWGGGTSLNWDKAEQYWVQMGKTHKVAVQGGYTGPLELLAAGEFDFFPATTFSSVVRLVNKGAPIGVAPTQLIPAQIDGFVALLKNGPNPNAAKLYIDHYTQPEGYTAHVSAGNWLPVPEGEYARGIKTDDLLRDLGSKPVWMPPELLSLEAQERSAEIWHKKLGIKKS